MTRGTSALLVVLLGACATPLERAPGGYYGGDRPPRATVDIAAIPDARPRNAPRSASGNRPYTQFGRAYTPLSTARGFVARGIASWYGEKFHGQPTASGEIYDMFAMTAAHPTLPLPTYARVTHLENGKSVVVKINDRGPFLHNRILDLSYVAARKLGIVASGIGRVEVRALSTDAVAPPRIFIQVGAYAKPDNARQMRKRLRAAGYAVVLVPQNVAAGGAAQRVRVGPFATRLAAQAQRAKLENLLRQKVHLVEN